MNSLNDATRILQSIESGDPHAAEQLLPLVYEELRRLAAAKMIWEKPGQTIQATALVHEAWLRLVQSNHQSWENRAHFFRAAAEAMRRILIDRARSKQAVKHGGGWKRVDFEMIDAPAEADEDTLMRVNDALEQLAHEDPQAAELVKLRFFTGLTIEETALAMGVTHRTAYRYWRYARVWLHDKLGAPDE